MLEKKLWEHATDYPHIPLERYSSLNNDPLLIAWQILDAEELQSQYLEAVNRGDEIAPVWMRLEMAYRFANGLVQFNQNDDTREVIEQDDAIDKFVSECERRKLKKGKTIPLDVYYEIGMKIFPERMPLVKNFRDGESTYRILHTYGSMKGDKKKRRET